MRFFLYTKTRVSSVFVSFIAHRFELTEDRQNFSTIQAKGSANLTNFDQRSGTELTILFSLCRISLFLF
ncbi:hypothetical protein L2E82_13210 [Cichorium intybus]|uniref:Uncharacterized protein n=1 Tax=Cichorium intybus TaxID=13427 RepID=A0ACB9GJG7_CICIN|nr:hypothetical protein L2E82_13210 [Cichorium intybus]